MPETVATALDRISECFASSPISYGQGTENPADEAAALVFGTLGVDWWERELHLGDLLSEAQTAELESRVRRRIDEHIPVAYLTGEAWFLGQRYLIEPGVVIPRSPIGELVDAEFKPWLKHPPKRILDLCSGSGCIGIACALAFPDSCVDLVDIDAEAVALSRRNAALHQVSNRVGIFQSDLYADLPPAQYDLIVCNPPYVNSDDYQAAPAEFSHEPRLGLHSGDDGLDLLRRILAETPDWLSAEGLFVGEAGYSFTALLEHFPRLEIIWPDLIRGGHGVFLLDAPWRL